jgi:hypothetical protein
MRSLVPVLRHLPQLALKAASLAWPPNAAVVGRNAIALAGGSRWGSSGDRAGGKAARERALDDALAWLCRSQDTVGSGGVGCYEFYRWTAGYPEVTGYIIPTFWDACRDLDRPELRDRVVRMAEWELTVQRPEGGWEGGYEGDGQPTVVFNTGQVIRGLVRTSEETGDDRYLASAKRAGDWIVENQEADGSWGKANFKGMKRVYDSYVAAPLVRLAQATSDDRYAAAAERNCAFVLAHQRENGWFELADNSPYFVDAPVTHTICYTIDGLIETGQLLGRDDFVDAGRRAADAMLACAHDWPRLFGRIDARWERAATFVCLTGVAQLGGIALRLASTTGETRYTADAGRLADFLVWVQRLNAVGRSRHGAIAGSYPIWGLYCPLKYPSWATKYFVDLLLGLRRTETAAEQAPGNLAGSSPR